MCEPRAYPRIAVPADSTVTPSTERNLSFPVSICFKGSNFTWRARVKVLNCSTCRHWTPSTANDKWVLFRQRPVCPVTDRKFRQWEMPSWLSQVDCSGVSQWMQFFSSIILRSKLCLGRRMDGFKYILNCRYFFFFNIERFALLELHKWL